MSENDLHEIALARVAGKRWTVEPPGSLAGGGPVAGGRLPREAEAIRAEGIRLVRLVAAPSRINPDTGASYVREAIANGADLDGVHGRYLVPSP